MTNFPKKLKAARKRAGLTQAEAAVLLEVGRTVYVQWEKGKRVASKLQQYGSLAVFAARR